MAADREKFETWFEKACSVPKVDRAPDGSRIECLGGPIDGMSASIAAGMFRLAGASLIVHASLVLSTNPGSPERLSHRYARDHRGAFVYVGVIRASEEPK